jgi:tRNA pseudouridine55 synthase
MNSVENKWQEGQVVLIDKEVGWTSFDVVKKVRNLVKVKKVGHAGTLDPLANGLLILCTGRMTKKIEGLMGMEKEYVGKLILGKTSPSVDFETPLEDFADPSGVTIEMITEAFKSFDGVIMQKPPMFSAIKKDGKRMYEKARLGQMEDIAPRPVIIHELELVGFEPPASVTFRLVCSKGFYVRSFVRDFGEMLGVGACLSFLRRTKIGAYAVHDAVTIEEFQSSVKADSQ